MAASKAELPLNNVSLEQLSPAYQACRESLRNFNAASGSVPYYQLRVIVREKQRQFNDLLAQLEHLHADSADRYIRDRLESFKHLQGHLTEDINRALSPLRPKTQVTLPPKTKNPVEPPSLLGYLHRLFFPHPGKVSTPTESDPLVKPPGTDTPSYGAVSGLS